MNNNKNIKLEFTPLTPNDCNVHENLYIQVLVCAGEKDPIILDKKYRSIFHHYAIKEVQKSKQLFQNTFK